MRTEIVDRGHPRMIGSTQEKAAPEAKPCSRVKIPTPPFYFFKKAILEMDSDETVQRFGPGNERGGDALRSLPRLFRYDVQACVQRGVDHQRNMRSWEHAKPRGLRIACTHCIA